MKTIGLDIGTTTVSAAVRESETGRQLCRLTVESGAEVPAGHPWERLQSPEKLESVCRSLISGLQKSCPDAERLGITGQMHGMLYLDGGGRALGALRTWEDGRGDRPCGDGRSFARRLSDVTGFPMATGYGLTTLYADRLSGLVPDGAACCCTITDYLALRLCGLPRPLTHPTNGAGFGLFSLQTLDFDENALEAAGISRSFLPEAVRGETRIGRFGELDVFIPIGDNQAGILGSGAEDGDAVLNIGTSCQISRICERPEAAEGLELRPYVGGKYLLLGAGLCGGSAFRLLNDFFRRVCRDAGRDVSPEEMFGLMAGWAEDARGLGDPPTVSPLFRGTRGEPSARGGIGNLGMDNFTPGALTLAFYRGVLGEMADAYRKMPPMDDGGRLILGGNALRKNPLLASLAEETFGRRAFFAPYPEEAAMGAAKLAAG